VAADHGPTVRPDFNLVAVTDLQRIAPDVEADIETALTELDRSVLEARIHDDPLRLPLSALASFLRAQRGLYVDSVVTMQRSIEAARQPVRDDDLRRAVVQGISSHASSAVRTMGWRNVLIGAAILVAVLAVGAGGGYWFRGAVPVLVGVRAGAEKCDDQRDGSRLCWIPVFERLPPTKGAGG
jgi:hypothetical protein